MGEKLWQDSLDETFYLENMGWRTIGFKSDTIDMAGNGALLNEDIPALIGALVRHLYNINETELLKEAGYAFFNDIINN